MNVKGKISALALCAALLLNIVGAAAAGFEDKRLEVMAGMTAGVSADIPTGMKKTAAPRRDGSRREKRGWQNCRRTEWRA